MKIPVSRLTKQELVWLNSHKCKKHKHTYLSHYSCYLKENPDRERVAFFDIETSGLRADYGIMLCWCIKPSDSDKIIGTIITKKEVFSRDLDKRMAREAIEELAKFDRVVGFYSSRFDIPFLRTRAVRNGLDFPHYGEMLHTDLYDVIKRKFRLHSNRLQNACEFLLGNSDKTRIRYEDMLRGIQGNQEALDYIYKHCEYDVRDLEKLYNITIDYKRHTNTSA